MNCFVHAALGLVVGTATATTANAQCVQTEDGSAYQCQTLFAGQTIDAGAVCVEIVGSDLVVTYETTGCWELTEAHAWVGDNIGDMPQTRKGNPKIGNFPHNSGDITGETFHSFAIPLADLGFSCPGDDTTYFVAAHAALRCDNGDGTYQTETGWADGSRFVERGAWGTFFSVILTCDCNVTPPSDPECETAFAFGGDSNTSICFLDIDEDNDGNGDFNRWGWTIAIPDTGEYSFPIYAGAGQCDLTKGTHVGNLEVIYTAETGLVQVLHVMLPGFSMNEMHLYAGSDILPTNGGQDTVAPGQYPVVEEDMPAAGWTWSWTADFVGDGGAIYLVAHAVVCSDNWPSEE
jgi:hypothetical protein